MEVFYFRGRQSGFYGKQPYFMRFEERIQCFSWHNMANSHFLFDLEQWLRGFRDIWVNTTITYRKYSQDSSISSTLSKWAYYKDISSILRPIYSHFLFDSTPLRGFKDARLLSTNRIIKIYDFDLSSLSSHHADIAI